MIVQWCIKGMSLSSDAEAKGILNSQGGLHCNWWRGVGIISPQAIRQKLTAENIDVHVNHFTSVNPATNKSFKDETPFISLSAGSIERDAVSRTNHVHRARKTALFFGTEFGRSPRAYLYNCWVILAPRPSPEIEHLAEEVRDLNSYRRYSAFQTEGEILAKVHVPDNHIQSVEKWELDSLGNRYKQTWIFDNPRFTRPEQLANLRELI